MVLAWLWLGFGLVFGLFFFKFLWVFGLLAFLLLLLLVSYRFPLFFVVFLWFSLNFGGFSGLSPGNGTSLFRGWGGLSFRDGGRFWGGASSFGGLGAASFWVVWAAVPV